ncbi:cyanocobalamin reductase / alkylcobalamin dealkylase-like isoform X2 [Symsagittifera roscoffensis]|uniref:cyanocobalamin reductase / alkylcobalamin dealkylase-like isoform X2 n=1 Tax=Symsagittifera roscoffensis TaxID=84072 RepID=UPI00307C2D0B
MDLSQEEFELIQSLLESQLTPFGFESSPLLIKWYNEQVDKKFKFKSIHEDSLAFCVTSTSEMFERGFLPFVFESGICRDLRNALDESIGFYLKKMCQDLQNYQPIFYRDSDLEPGTRRPAFLAQTAAHVSGVAYYYHPSEIIQSAKREGIPLPWSEEDQQGRVYGVSIHHKYGGWFAIRVFLQVSSFCKM